jgi:hypothetical protein
MIKFHRREREAGLAFGDDVATIPGQFQFRTIELKNVLLLFFQDCFMQKKATSHQARNN